MTTHRSEASLYLNVNSSIFVLIFMGLVIIFTIMAPTTKAEDLSVPAQFVQYLTLPGETNIIQRPSKIFVDHHFNEIYVTDPGNNRVLIFDSLNFFRYEFSGRGHFSMPLDLAVDSKGYIYILAATAKGRELMKFDFDGSYIKTLTSVSPDESGQFDIRSIAIDDSDRIFAMDEKGCQVVVFDGDGNRVDRFPVFSDMTDKGRGEIVTGETCISGGRLYIPVSNVGMIYVYDLAGKLVRMIGHKGSNPGEMAFPVSVAVNKTGIVMILDKLRFNVICYTPDGKFLGEFGGKGLSPGWFYHPTLLAAIGTDEVYVGQIFRNRIQLCTIPEFIRTKASRLISQLPSHSHKFSSSVNAQVFCFEEVIPGTELVTSTIRCFQHFLIPLNTTYYSMEVLQNA